MASFLMSYPCLICVSSVAQILSNPNNSRLLSPIVKSVGQRLIQGEGRRPADFSTKLAGVAANDRGVAGSNLRGLLTHFHSQSRHAQQTVQNRLHGMNLACGGIVNFAFLTLFHDENVSSNHVANIGEVANRA